MLRAGSLKSISPLPTCRGGQAPCCSFPTWASKVGKFRGEKRWQGRQGRACCSGDFGHCRLVRSWNPEGASWVARAEGRPRRLRSAVRWAQVHRQPAPAELTRSGRRLLDPQRSRAPAGEPATVGRLSAALQRGGKQLDTMRGKKGCARENWT